jgi:hypothetical protein
MHICLLSTKASAKKLILKTTSWLVDYVWKHLHGIDGLNNAFQDMTGSDHEQIWLLFHLLFATDFGFPSRLLVLADVFF